MLRKLKEKKLIAKLIAFPVKRDIYFKGQSLGIKKCF